MPLTFSPVGPNNPNTQNANPIAPVGGLSFAPKVNPFVSASSGIKSGVKTVDLTKSQSAVDKGLQSTINRLTSSPKVVASGNLNPFIEQARQIAAGKSGGGSGVFGSVLAPVANVLKGAGTVFQLPHHLIASTVKETLDGLSGNGGFSPTDWFKQLGDSGFGYGTIIKDYGGITGNSALDSAIGLGFDIALDPLTYIGVSEVKYASRAGRLALATKAAEAGHIAEMPSLAGKIDRIARIGQWALDDTERAYLNIEKGLRLGHSVNAKVIPYTGGVAEAIGKNWAKSRALLGDAKFAQYITSNVLPKSVASLNDVGRGVMNSKQATEALAGWTAQSHGVGAGKTFTAKMASEHSVLINDIANSPFRETLVHVVEKTVPASSPAEQVLADRVVAFYDSMLNGANSTIKDFAAKHGVVGATGINNIDNYSTHVITPEAMRWISTSKNSPTQDYINVLLSGELSTSDLLHGVGPARMRKLTAGKEFMGSVLQTGSIQEINAISEAKFGFKFFKEDMPTVLNSYIHSMGSQVQRTAAVDRLMDFGIDYIKPILQKSVPDPQVVKGWQAAVNSIKKAQRILRNDVAVGTNAVERAAVNQKSRLEGAVAKGLDNVASVSLRESSANSALTTATEQLASLQSFADGLVGPEKEALQQVVDSAKAYIAKLQGHIDNGLVLHDQTVQKLQVEYVRLFPNAKNIPEDSQVLVDRITAANARESGKLDKLLKTRDSLTAKVKTLRSSTRQDAKAIGAAESALADVQAEVDALDWITKSATDASYSSNGLVYIPASDLSNTNNVAVVMDAHTSNVLNGDPSQVIAMRAPANVMNVTDPNMADSFLGALSEGLGLVVSHVGQVSLELSGVGEEFAASLNDVIQFGDYSRIDPMFEQVHPELMHIIDSIANFKMAAQDAASTVGVIPEYVLTELTSSITSSLEAFATANNLPMGFSDTAISDAMGWGISTLQGEEVGFVMPASIFDPASNVGETVLVLHRRSGLFDPNNLDSAPSLLSDNAMYGQVTMGKNDPLEMDLLAKENDIKTQLTSLRDAGATNTPKMVAAQELSTQLKSDIAKQRRVTGRLDEVLGTSNADLAKADTVTVYERTPSGGRKRVVYTRDSAERAIKSMEKEVTRAVRKIDALNYNVSSQLLVTPEGVTGTLAGAGGARAGVERAQRVFNKAEILAADAKAWTEVALPQYQEDLARVTKQIANNPVKGPAGATSASWANETNKLLRSLDEKVRAGDKQLEALQRVVQQLAGDEADLAMLETVTLPRAEMYASAAKSGVFGSKLVNDITKGWKSLEGLGVQMSPEIYASIAPNMERLAKGVDVNNLLKLYKDYNTFFKVYATMTPGFSVRNAISSTFMNYVAGVSTRSIGEGLQAAKSYTANGANTWIDKLGLSISDKALYEEAYRRLSATGAGQTADDIMGPVLNGRAGRITNNAATRLSGKANTGVEFAARFSMAINDVRAGLTFDEGVTRISRFHFNYTDLSNLDSAMKNFVPFWLWTSRNVPLQIANMWTRPSMYQMYSHIQENMKPDSSLLMPKWLAESGPLKLTSGIVLTPDLPQLQLKKQIEMLSDPKRLASNLNPILKTPIEMLGSNQLQTDIPFGTKPVPAKGLDLLAAALAAPFGQTQVDANGQVVINPKLQYALGNILPPVARLQRLAPQVFGGKSSYADRQISSIGGTLGLPFRQITANEQKNEAIRRQFELASLVTKLSNLGYIEKKKK